MQKQQISFVEYQANTRFLMNEDIKKIVSWIKDKEHVDVSVFADAFLLDTINHRIRMLPIECSLASYFTHISTNAGETAVLVKMLLNSHSEFFRNPLTFALLEQLVIPTLLNDKNRQAPYKLRIWSAACAAGHETYSLAILLDELAKLRGNDFSYQIFATDCSEHELELAKTGVYEYNFVQKVSLQRINAYFEQRNGAFAVVPGLKRNIDFSHHNLLDEVVAFPPASIYGDFDIVLCSNILFYYKPQLVHHILNNIHNSINARGFMVTGEAEHEVVLNTKRFLPIHPYVPIFKKH